MKQEARNIAIHRHFRDHGSYFCEETLMTRRIWEVLKSQVSASRAGSGVLYLRIADGFSQMSFVGDHLACKPLSLPTLPISAVCCRVME